MRRNIILGVVLVLIAGAAIYFLNSKNNAPSKIETPAIQKVDWKSQIPEIKKIIEAQFKEGPSSREVEVYKEGDITGDGIPEALVYTGFGGAYTDELTLIQIKDGKPILAQFKDDQGTTLPLTFLLGASVRHGEAVDISPKDHTIYSASWALDDNGKIETCEVQVYLWNKNTNLFEYDKVLSDGSKSTLCGVQE